MAVDAPTNLKAVPSCQKDPTTGQFTVSTITFTWDSASGNTEDYFQTNGMANEVDVGKGGQNEGVVPNESTILPSASVDDTPLPYNTTYQWHIRTHDTGLCLVNCDATTDGPAVKTSDCTVQPTTTYNCDTTTYTCNAQTGVGGEYTSAAACTAGCVIPQAAYNYTCANRSPACDTTQYPQSRCVDYRQAVQTPCPQPPDGCFMVDNTATPNPSHSCAFSKDYIPDTNVPQGGTCYQNFGVGGDQGNCANSGLYCDLSGASPLDPGVCQPVPTAWGTQCNTCFSSDHWVGTDTSGSCVNASGQDTAPASSTYCNINGQNNEGCNQGTGCYVLAGGGVIEPSTFATPPPVCINGVCETAIGNIETSAEGFVKSVMGLILSLVGGIAILLIIISGYRLMVSQGNPENVKNARDQLTAAIIGLLFVIFSLVILQVIGVNILGLPGFNP